MTNVNYRGVLTESTPTKSLTHGFRRAVGRNSQGRITTRHKGSGHKRLYRDVDFMYDKKDLTLIAKERLKALEDAQELGAGYRIALRDLELRGAGNILGKEQSGAIAEKERHPCV